MKQLFFLIIFINTLFLDAIAQTLITFKTSDSVLVSADLYEAAPEAPYILLFHQSGYSRGEYKEIAPRLVKIGFNCIAVDLRSGGEVNYVQNETFRFAQQNNINQQPILCERDIIAAIDYAFNKSNKKVILFGSSFSASLCLKVACNNNKIKAVITFSPGEFFKSDFVLKDVLKDLKIPVFAASSQREFSYIVDLFSNVNKSYLSLFKPEQGQGVHGAKCLWESSDSSREYWLALLIFLKKQKEQY